MKVTFLGHAGFLIETGDCRLLIDPFLDGNPLAVQSSDQVEADYILLTHGHSDHLGDALPIASRCGSTIIAPFELATYCQKKGADVHPMHIGGGFNFPFGRVKLTQAFHGSAIGEEMLAGGNPCGFILELEDKVIYHAGDTGLFGDMQLIGELYDLDLAMLPIGDNFVMGIDDALRAAEFIRARAIIPMHYGTFEVIDQDPKLFVEGLQAMELDTEAIVLAPGEDYNL